MSTIKNYQPILSQEEIKDEKWFKLPPNKEISNLGRLRKTYQTKLTFKGGAQEIRTHHIYLCQNKSYFTIHLAGRSKSKPIARAVWETFVGPIPEGQDVCHKNRNTKDHRLSNLMLSPRGHGPRAKYRPRLSSHLK